jgi:3'(2'), 5'-bisphosphate nucleotidase
MTNTEDLRRELEVATELAHQAGAVAQRFFRSDDLCVDEKARGEPVTEADRGSERVILAGLRQAFAGDGLLSEEQADHTSWATHRRSWVVDPLDGTKDFVGGREGWSVMIGLLIDARPVLGVVHQPVVGLTYRAARGAGAELLRRGTNAAERLQPSAVADPVAARLVTSYSHRSEMLADVRDELGITDELAIGSVGLKVGLVARGLRDLYLNPEGHCRLWDTCAPEAILVEAGGRMTDIFGQPLAYDHTSEVRVLRGIIASNGACHQAVVDQLRPLFGEPRDLIH